MRSSVVVALACLAIGSLSTGCTVAEDDPRTLGRFEVRLTQTESCGEGVIIEGPAEESLFVFLRRPSDDFLLWVERTEVFSLTVRDDGTFAGTDARTSTFGEAGTCRLLRDDELEAAFDGPLTDTASGFTGTLRNTFSLAEGSDCADMMTAPVPLAETLPCTLGYDLDAVRMD